MNNNVNWNKQQYLNIETFRKTSVGVKTPVWFVRDGDKLFVRTIADSGKVKRIRNNSNVNIAACKSIGALLGDWIPANARIVGDSDVYKQVERLLDKKYGLMKKMFAMASVLQGRQSTVLEINIKE